MLSPPLESVNPSATWFNITLLTPRSSSHFYKRPFHLAIGQYDCDNKTTIDRPSCAAQTSFSASWPSSFPLCLVRHIRLPPLMEDDRTAVLTSCHSLDQVWHLLRRQHYQHSPLYAGLCTSALNHMSHFPALRLITFDDRYQVSYTHGISSPRFPTITSISVSTTPNVATRSSLSTETTSSHSKHSASRKHCISQKHSIRMV